MCNYVLEPVSEFKCDASQETAPFWVTHTKGWAKVLERSFPHLKGYVFSERNTVESQRSFLPIYRVQSPLKKNASWISIPYATISDPVLKGKKESEPLLSALADHPSTRNCSIEIRTCHKLPAVSPFTSSCGYINHQLYLDKDEKEIFKSFHRTAVQVHIKKSLQSGISLRVASSIADVNTFYRIYISMRRELGLPPQPLRFFRNMWEELTPDRNLELLLAEKDGKVIAGMWVLKNNWLYSFEYLARAGVADKTNSTHFLYWHGIKSALESKIPVVSFARTWAKNKGLNQFKSRWGTVGVPYYDLKFPALPESHREDKFLYSAIKKYSSILPIPLFRLLGEIIYRII